MQTLHGRKHETDDEPLLLVACAHECSGSSVEMDSWQKYVDRFAAEVWR